VTFDKEVMKNAFKKEIYMSWDNNKLKYKKKNNKHVCIEHGVFTLVVINTCLFNNWNLTNTKP